jgi:glycosyltransferase involved in cell wall biosynthesis
MLKAAHLVAITPNRCGLYETTRELVAGLRKQGVDSRMVDPTKNEKGLQPPGDNDRGALFADEAWALEADILVNHSGLGDVFEASKQPIVHVAHGRPRSSFISERDGSTPIYSYHYNKNKDPRFKAVVTFWPEHAEYHQVMFPDKPVKVVTAPVDLDAWKPEGPKGYNFHGTKGQINVVCTDAWRDDIDPFVVLNAYALWARSVKGAKLHLYAAGAAIKTGLKGWKAILQRIQDDGNMGEICPWVSGLDNVYRAADIMLTPHKIATRSIREAMACGCPVVQVVGDYLNGFRKDFDLAKWKDRKEVRRDAERLFNPERTAKEFKAVLEGAL